MRQMVLHGAAKTLFVLGLLAGPVGWIGVRTGLFGHTGEDVRDAVTGFGTACLVGAVIVAYRHNDR